MVQSRGHVVVPKSSLAGRWGPESRDMWQCVNARSAPCLDVELITGGGGTLKQG
jgi:hypothetical protein